MGALTIRQVRKEDLGDCYDLENICFTPSEAANKENLEDESLKQMVGFVPDGNNLVVFSLCVSPEF